MNDSCCLFTLLCIHLHHPEVLLEQIVLYKYHLPEVNILYEDAPCCQLFNTADLLFGN